MIITPDFSEAVELKNEPIVPGVYKTRITDCEQKTARSGSKYLNWKLTIFGAEGDFARQNNRPVFMMTMIEGKGAGRLKEFAKAALGRVPTPIDTDEFLGKEVEVVLVERRMDDGTISNYPDVKTVRAVRA